MSNLPENWERDFFKGLKREAEKVYGKQPTNRKHIIISDLSPVNLPSYHTAFWISDSFREANCDIKINYENLQDIFDIRLWCKFEDCSNRLLAKIIQEAIDNCQREIKLNMPAGAYLADNVFVVKYLLKDSGLVVEMVYDHLNERLIKINKKIQAITLRPVVIELDRLMLEHIPGQMAKITYMII